MAVAVVDVDEMRNSVYAQNFLCAMTDNIVDAQHYFACKHNANSIIVYLI